MEAQRQLDVYTAFEQLQARPVGVEGWGCAGGRLGGCTAQMPQGSGGTLTLTSSHCVPPLCLKGAGGLFFTGEYLNGLGVPLQAYGAQALVDAHFA